MLWHIFRLVLCLPKTFFFFGPLVFHIHFHYVGGLIFLGTMRYSSVFQDPIEICLGV